MTAKTKAKTNSVPPGLKRLRKSANAETIRAAILTDQKRPRAVKSAQRSPPRPVAPLRPSLPRPTPKRPQAATKRLGAIRAALVRPLPPFGKSCRTSRPGHTAVPAMPGVRRWQRVAPSAPP